MKSGWLLRLTILVSIASFFRSPEAAAHARLTYPPPRNNSDGLKSGPCGNVPKTATPTVLTAGQIINVQWVETINHPGYFTFELSTNNDVTFTNIMTVQDMQNTAGMHTYQQTMTVPNMPCTNCTFRMIQYMTENPANPSPYFSCADVTIMPAGGGNPPPPPPPGGGQTGQSGVGTSTGPGAQMGGCGLVSSNSSDGGGSSGSGLPLAATVLFLPLVALLIFRARPAAMG